MRVTIIANRYLNTSHTQRTIGGIQNYIYNLCILIKEMNFEPVVIQRSTQNFSVNYDGYIVIGISCAQKYYNKKAISKVGKNEIVIFATEGLISKYEGKKIAIQHGIGWDIPVHEDWNRIRNRLYSIKRFIDAQKKIQKLAMVDKVVCVDHNFVNWYRTQIAYPEMRLEVIPNFSRLIENCDKPKDKINIIFARRFFDYRGTRIFAQAAKRISQKYKNVFITIAGEGPDEQYLHKELGLYPNIRFTHFDSEESLEIHSKMHIAVIPTIGSEGTSLSLLEAMSAQCAVVCTNVGGMTNIVLDMVNGLMINPDTDSLVIAIEKLITDHELRDRLSKYGYITVQKGFSIDLWKSKWKCVIQKIVESK